MRTRALGQLATRDSTTTCVPSPLQNNKARSTDAFKLNTVRQRSDSGSTWIYRHDVRSLHDNSSTLQLKVNRLPRLFKALWLYDYVQTFSTEVQAIWLRKISAMSVIFLLNRYLMLLGIIAGMYEDAPGTGTITR